MHLISLQVHPFISPLSQHVNREMNSLIPSRNQFLQYLSLGESQKQKSKLVKHNLDLFKLMTSYPKDSSNTCLELELVIRCWFPLVLFCNLTLFCPLFCDVTCKCSYSWACPSQVFIGFLTLCIVCGHSVDYLFY